jgi:hypothetical protein
MDIAQRKCKPKEPAPSGRSRADQALVLRHPAPSPPARTAAASLKLGRDRTESRFLSCAEVRLDGDDRRRNPGGDQTGFDGRRSRFVFRKAQRKILHSRPTSGWRRPRGQGSAHSCRKAGKLLTITDEQSRGRPDGSDGYCPVKRNTSCAGDERDSVRCVTARISYT